MLKISLTAVPCMYVENVTSAQDSPDTMISQHFEALVEQHFQNRCQNILVSCKEYMKGVPVGFAFMAGDKEEERKGSSTGFKIMLSKLFKKLVEAFSDKGIDCSQFLGP